MNECIYIFVFVFVCVCVHVTGASNYCLVASSNGA